MTGEIPITDDGYRQAPAWSPRRLAAGPGTRWGWGTWFTDMGVV
jgi:hypothetical protein